MFFTRVYNHVFAAMNIAVTMGRISAHRAAVGVYLHPSQRSASLGAPAVCYRLGAPYKHTCYFFHLAFRISVVTEKVRI
jgi:hypothetical protein